MGFLFPHNRILQVFPAAPFSKFHFKSGHTRNSTVDIIENPIISLNFPSSKLNEVIKLTLAGRKKKARFSSKKIAYPISYFEFNHPCIQPEEKDEHSHDIAWNWQA